LTGYFLFDNIAAILANAASSNMGGGSRIEQLAGVLESVNRTITLRIDTWLNPWPEASTRGYQIIQSLYAVATGGLFGQGVGQGDPDFIPVVHSDFVFAAVAEEWGLIGAVVLIGVFAIIAYRGLRIAADSRRPFSLYLASGITIIFTFQALLILAGVTKLLPLTGITLPFISYGGSSMLASCIMVGLLLNLSAPGSRLHTALSRKDSEPVVV
jgi:cell division protein FtsW